jgi:hypothetical protein
MYGPPCPGYRVRLVAEQQSLAISEWSRSIWRCIPRPANLYHLPGIFEDRHCTGYVIHVARSTQVLVM